MDIIQRVKNAASKEVLVRLIHDLVMDVISSNGALIVKKRVLFSEFGWNQVLQWIVPRSLIRIYDGHHS